MAPPETPARPAVTLENSSLDEMSKNERIKAESKGLYYVSGGKGGIHTFRDEIDALESGARPTIGAEAKELSKFHGIYKQQGRGERGRRIADDYFFMVRLKCPAGGAIRPAQWFALDDAADAFGDGTLRLTSRQSVQFHHVYGPKLAPLIRHLSRGYRRDGTLSACGDVNRNVMTSPLDTLDPDCDVRGQELAYDIAQELAPRSSSYFQVWLSDAEGNKHGVVSPEEPLYGSQYLPRKFKIGIAHPKDNSIDVLTQDVGFVPVVGSGIVPGSVWDLHSGGGLGLTHHNETTAPLLGLYLGRIPREQVVEASRAIAILQKEHGERKDRRLARWKYTIRRLGVEAVKASLRARFGIDLEDAEQQPFAPIDLLHGWHPQRGGGGYYGLSIEGGRIGPELRRGIRAAVAELGLTVRLTPQQDLVLCDVADRRALETLLERHGVALPESIGRVRRNSMACPAKPTCGLAMTEAERILPQWIDEIEQAGLGDVDVVIRMTGCPNGCARPPTAEIGIFGYGKNDHVVLIGGSRECSRLAHTLYERIPTERMAPVLVGILRAIRDHNPERLAAGDFLHQADPAQLRAWIGIEDGG
ncbi:MAG: NADPH-dependent assimilatory sulfite reductase hemoprotein subunit [Deltaproteobacteria bacterium]|nr:NADPH-dependent assimilatory sulfite reductase hemoprotein subunit [Deltaproteobacteria bacterium]